LELKSQQIVNADVLVLGGGAGLRAAIEARKHGVSVLQVCEKVRKAENDMVNDCQVTIVRSVTFRADCDFKQS